MPAGIYNFTIEQGATWARTFYFAQSGAGRVFPLDSSASVAVDATAKTFTRDDGGSWLDDGLADGDYIVHAGFGEAENNGSHLITDLTATVITCAGSTLKDEAVSPSVSGEQLVILKAMDLTDYTGAAMVRKKYSSTTSSATMTVAFDPIRTNGAVSLSLTNTQTSAIPCGEDAEGLASQYVWDFELTKTAVVTRMLQGTVSVSPEATK